MDEKVERVAKAICAANNDGKFEFDATGKDEGDDGYSPEWLYYVNDAESAITALQELGLIS